MCVCGVCVCVCVCMCGAIPVHRLVGHCCHTPIVPATAIHLGTSQPPQIAWRPSHVGCAATGAQDEHHAHVRLGRNAKLEGLRLPARQLRQGDGAAPALRHAIGCVHKRSDACVTACELLAAGVPRVVECSWQRVRSQGGRSPPRLTMQARTRGQDIWCCGSGDSTVWRFCQQLGGPVCRCAAAASKRRRRQQQRQQQSCRRAWPLHGAPTTTQAVTIHSVAPLNTAQGVSTPLEGRFAAKSSRWAHTRVRQD